MATLLFPVMPGGYPFVFYAQKSLKRTYGINNFPCRENLNEIIYLRISLRNYYTNECQIRVNCYKLLGHSAFLWNSVPVGQKLAAASYHYVLYISAGLCKVQKVITQPYTIDINITLLPS